MTKTYFSVLTQYGEALFTQSLANHQPINIIQMAVGDGNGQAVIPSSTQTRLVHEVHRANVSAVIQDPRNHSQVIFELTIPENIGGFTIREMGIFDNKKKLVAIANTPETYKTRLDEGSAKVQVLRIILKLSSSEQVTLTVDNSVIFATKGQLTPKTITSDTENTVDDTGHSHKISEASTSQKGIVQLDDSWNSNSQKLALTARVGKALKDLIDSLNRNLSNYIPNSKKSDSINSNSSDKIATSKAIKTLNDEKVSKINSETLRIRVGYYDFGLQADGNFVTYNSDGEVNWASNKTILKNDLSDAINLNSSSKVATSKAVKTLNDEKVSKINSGTLRIRVGNYDFGLQDDGNFVTYNSDGEVKWASNITILKNDLSDAINLDSSSKVATSKAVKTLNDEKLNATTQENNVINVGIYKYIFQTDGNLVIKRNNEVIYALSRFAEKDDFKVYGNKNSGYRKTVDGYIEQWFVAAIPDGSRRATFNFPISFKEACFGATITDIATGDYAETFSYKNENKTSISIYCGSAWNPGGVVVRVWGK